MKECKNVYKTAKLLNLQNVPQGTLKIYPWETFKPWVKNKREQKCSHLPHCSTKIFADCWVSDSKMVPQRFVVKKNLHPLCVCPIQWAVRPRLPHIVRILQVLTWCDQEYISVGLLIRDKW